MVSKRKSTGLARKRKTKKTTKKVVKRRPAMLSAIITPNAPPSTAPVFRAAAGRKGTKRKTVRKAPPKPPGRSALPKLVTRGALKGTIAAPRLRMSRTGGLVGSKVRKRVTRMREVK